MKASKLIIEIPIKCPSRNILYSGKHWSVRSRMANEIHDLVFCCVIRQKERTKFNTCFITYVCQFKDKRRHDPCNMEIKLFQDGLVKAGVIPDDNSDVVKLLQIIVETGCKQDKVIICVEECNER
jgi:hypothetical protein